MVSPSARKNVLAFRAARRRTARIQAAAIRTAACRRCSHPSSNRSRSGAGRSSFVGEIVGGARERVDRRDVRPHRARQQQRRDRKVLVVRRGRVARTTRTAASRLASPFGLGHAGAVVGRASHDEQQVGQAVEIDDDDRVRRRRRRARRRAARRGGRPFAPDAAARRTSDPPGRMNRRSGGSSSSSRSIGLLEALRRPLADRRLRRRAAAMRDDGSASRAPTANSSFWTARSRRRRSRRPRRPRARRPDRRSARRPRRTHRPARRPSTRACCRRATSRRSRRSLCRSSSLARPDDSECSRGHAWNYRADVRRFPAAARGPSALPPHAARLVPRATDATCRGAERATRITSSSPR